MDAASRKLRLYCNDKKAAYENLTRVLASFVHEQETVENFGNKSHGSIQIDYYAYMTSVELDFLTTLVNCGVRAYTTITKRKENVFRIIFETRLSPSNNTGHCTIQ